MAKLIGMCGRSGSGKTYVADMFELLGVPSIDCDKVYRNLTSAGSKSTCMSEIKLAFGDASANPDGSLNRAYVGSVVFGDKSGVSLARLNAITHKHILSEVYRIAEEYATAGKPLVLVDAPTLYESGLDKNCEATVCIIADEAKRIKRICNRDGITEEKAKARLASQMSDAELIDRCDFVIPCYGHDEITMAAVKHAVYQIKSEQV